jgi:truncated hemoglobin YjbI
MRTLRCSQLALVAVFLTAGAATVARAADPEILSVPPKQDQKSFDDKVRKSLFDLINHGVDLYNGGDTAACFSVYEGGLWTIYPLLDQHPDIQKLIDEGVREAQNLSRMDERAWHLRKVLDKVRADLKGGERADLKGGEPAPPGPRNLWARLGGEKNVAKIVDDFVLVAVSDKNVNFTRDGKYKLDAAFLAKMKRQAVELISAASGGPLKYTGRDMKEVHKEMGITDAEFDAISLDFKKALEKNGVLATDVEEAMKLVEASRKNVVAQKKTSDGPRAAKTLWDRLGGEDGVGDIVKGFIETVAAVREINFYRKPNFQPTAEQTKALREKFVDYISSVSGGPRKYDGKTMKAAHAGMQITEEQFDSFVEYFKAVLQAKKVQPDDMQLLMDAVISTKKDIVEPKKPDDKKADDKPADKKVDDKKPGPDK